MHQHLFAYPKPPLRFHTPHALFGSKDCVSTLLAAGGVHQRSGADGPYIVPPRAEEPFAAAADATEASASALAARDTEATSAEQPVVKAGPNAQKPKPAHGIVKSRPTKEQRERMERNRLAALDRLAVTRASSP